MKKYIDAFIKRLFGSYENEDWQSNYLKDNSFLKELNFKIWITKSARFNASARCAELNRCSAKIVGWLSAYAIIISSLTLVDFPYLCISKELNTFIAIALSILILVYSQMELAMDYSVKSKDYHTCALELSDLYNRLRILKHKCKLVKTGDGKEVEDLTEADFKELETINNEYEQILKKYDNHLPIDYSMAQIGKYKYFKISFFNEKYTRFKYFCCVKLQYYLCVYGLPLLYCFLNIFVCKNLN